jgi:uncharacterized protein
MISTTAMVLRVSDLPKDGVHIETLEQPEWLDNLPELWYEDSGIKLISKVGIDLELKKVLKEVSVIGNVKLSVQSPCSRCVEPVKIELNPQISLVLSPGNKIGEEDINLEHETYQGDEIDLSNYIREQVAISLPVKVVCTEDCKGLCTTCGVNLNNDCCECDKDQIDPRFAILKDLKI